VYIINLKNISKTYHTPSHTVNALSQLQLRVEKGCFMAITGRSGCGKSTLMNILGCLDRPDEGTYFLAGRRVDDLSASARCRVRGKYIGFVFQSFNLLPGLSALENVELPLIYAGMERKRRRELALWALERVDMADRASHRPAQLSGGQQQRVALARAAAGDPPLILCDEPTGNLDAACARAVTALLRAEAERGKTVVLITHDSEVAACADRRGRLESGKLYSEG